MIPDMIAVRVRDESEWLALPRIEPQGLARQLEPAMEPDGNQGGILNWSNPLVQRGLPVGKIRNHNFEMRGGRRARFLPVPL